ncbi:hypothetical protein MTO96_035590, partial [Rhipicephalus appendiculatus]
YSRQVANHPSLVIFVVFSLATTAIVASLTLWELPSFTDPPQGEVTRRKISISGRFLQVFVRVASEI